MTMLIIYGICRGAVYSLIAVGFSMIFNVLKFSNFSHGGVMVTCAYIGFVFARRLGMGLLPTLLLSALSGGLLAMGIEFIGFRRPRKKKSNALIYFVSTVTISTLLSNLMILIFGGTYNSYPSFFKVPTIRMFGIKVSKIEVMCFAISIAALVALILLLQKTKFGIAVRAISMDARTTNLMGVNSDLLISIVFFISGVFGGLAGVFLGMTQTLTTTMGSLVVKGFMASAIGGLGSFAGAIIGAFAIAMMETICGSIPKIGSGYAPVITFVVVLVFLLIRPRGILGKSAIDKA